MSMQNELNKGLRKMAKISNVIEELNRYSEIYEFNFQFWGKGTNHCYVLKGDVELTVISQEETIESCMIEVLKYIYKINRVPNEKRAC